MSTQSYLPLVNNGLLLGLLPIATTTFTGTETTVSGIDIEKIVFTSVKPPFKEVWYMGVKVSDSDTRTKNYLQTPNLIRTDFLYQKHKQWRMLPGYSYDGTQPGGFFIAALNNILTGVSLPAPSTVPPTVPPTPPTGSSAVQYFTLRAPFVDAPECSFVDINWVEKFAVTSGNTDPAYLEILSQPAPLAGLLKMYIIQNSAATGMSRGVLNNTVRIIRTSSAPIAAGSYTFGLRIHSTNGTFTDVNLTLTLVQMAA